MLTCKQVSRALAENDYKDLPFIKRMMLRFHVTICFVCGKFNNNIMLFQDMARNFRRYEENDAVKGASEEAKAKWASTLETQAAADESR